MSQEIPDDDWIILMRMLMEETPKVQSEHVSSEIPVVAHRLSEDELEKPQQLHEKLKGICKKKFSAQKNFARSQEILEFPFTPCITSRTIPLVNTSNAKESFLPARVRNPSKNDQSNAMEVRNPFLNENCASRFDKVLGFR